MFKEFPHSRPVNIIKGFAAGDEVHYYRSSYFCHFSIISLGEKIRSIYVILPKSSFFLPDQLMVNSIVHAI